MKLRHRTWKMLIVKLCGCLLLSATLAACGDNASTGSTDNRRTSSGGETQDNAASTTQTSADDSAPATQQSAGSLATQVCRKYDSCGCQKYDDCMAQIGNDPSIDQPGVGDCMLKSSCQSLCAGKPDGCAGSNPGAGNPGGAPQRTNCAAIHCGKNSDCPTECYGGCGDFHICLSF